MSVGRPPKPIGLMVAEGKTHLTKDEIKKREELEVKVPFLDVQAPDSLPSALRKEFDEIADKLLAINIMTELDVDVLARYLIARDQYERITKKMTPMLKKKDVDWTQFERLQKIQDRAFKQCQATASSLGLTIGSRARLVVPERPAPPTNRFMAKFGDKHRANHGSSED